VILSNVQIVACLGEGKFKIDPIAGMDPSREPFNTSAVDLRLSDEIRVPEDNCPVQYDLRQGGIANFLKAHSELVRIREDQPFSLKPGKLILANTLEKVSFPIHHAGNLCYSARVEGKSSQARCGVMIHLTAPTIHANFTGKITLEIVNLGTIKFLLFPYMYICQLIIEEIQGCPVTAPNQFSEQTDPTGTRS
jgi:dCTP deaminase